MIEQGVAGLNPARFNFLNFFLCFKSEGWWLFNKKLQIIVISLPQDSLLFDPLCLTPFQCVEQVANLVELYSHVRDTAEF